MIRSMSEAMAETVGSMMSSHCGNGRYLQPVYFSMELVLRFNLGPLHQLDSLIQEILKRHRKNYERSTTRINRLVTKNVNLSAAVNTFRRKAEDNSRFPASFWLNWEH